MGVVTLLALSIALRAEPARVVLRERDRVELHVAVPGATPDATLEVWTSAGTIANVRRESREMFRATWRAPAERYPQVALVLATVRGAGAQERAWLALPLVAHETLQITTKPRSQVELSLAGATFGPVRADATGKARIKVLVPPGQRTALVHVRDPFGNVNETSVDLRPPPFPRVRLLPLAERASWTDAQPIGLEVFAVTPQGLPAPAAELTLSADRGALGTPQERAPGVFRVTFRAPESAGGFATVRATASHELPGDTARIALLPGPPARIRVRADPAQVSGAGEVRITAEVVDERGNAVAMEGVRLSADAGTLQAEGAAALLRVPAAHEGRKEIRVSAVAGALSGTAAIALRSGAVEHASIRLPAVAREGDTIEPVVQLTDGGGNPVAGAALSVTAEGARAEAPRELGEGAYTFRLQLPRLAGPEGTAKVRVRAGIAEETVSIPVLHDERPRDVLAGVFAGGQSNLSRANAFSLQAEIAAHPGLAAIEVLARTGFFQYAPAEASPGGISQRAELRALTFAAGARASMPLRGRFSLHATLLAGALRSFGAISVQSGLAAGLRQGTAQWGLFGAAAAGASMGTANGRAFAEVQLAQAPGRGDVAGNLGGVGLSIGYLFHVR